VRTELATVASEGGPGPRPAAPARSPRRERTRERLFEAASEVFTRDGFQGASIEAICEAAGFTRGAFYSNFASKEELFLALTERQARQDVAAIEATVAGLDAGVVSSEGVDRDAVRRVLTAVTCTQGTERSWFAINAEFELLAMRDPEVGARWTQQQQALRGELAAALSRVLAGIGARFAVEPRVAVDLLLGAWSDGARTAFVAGRAAPEPDALEALVSLLVVAER
jgi:AcrR family transcriptional regulator